MDLLMSPPADGLGRRIGHVNLGQQADAALASRMLIGQAVGILMHRDGLGSEAAFALLVHTSQQTNTKLRDVARRLVVQVDEVNRRH